jgi:hypothetical protein
MSVHQSVAAAINVVAKLPSPKPAVTVPLIIIFAVIVVIGLLRKVVGLAVIAAILCVLFLIYQSGAFTK